MEFTYLKAYAAYILDNCLEEFVRIHIQRAKAIQLPLLQLFSSFTDEQLFAYAYANTKQLMQSLAAGRVEEAIRQNYDRWKTGQIPDIPSDTLAVKDIVFAPHTRKYAFIKLLKNYTTDFAIYEEVMQETDLFYSLQQELYLQTFAGIQQELLKHEKDFLNTLLDNTADGISVYDTAGKLTLWNRALEQRSGIMRNQVLGRNMFLLFSQYKDEHTLDAVARVLAGESVSLRNMPLENKSGYYEADLIPVFNKEGAVIGGITFSRDVTEKKLAEEKLKKSEAVMAQAQSVAHVGSFEWDASTGKITWSDELYRIFGYQPRSLAITKEWLMQHIHPDSLEEIAHLSAKTIRTAGVFETTLQIVRQDKSLCITHSRGMVVLDDAGHLVKIFGATQDVTRHKQNELKQIQAREEIRQKNQELAHALEELSRSKAYLLELNSRLEEKVQERTDELRKSENQLRLVTDALPVLVSYIDAAQRYTFVNKTYIEWFGKPLSAIQGFTMRALVGEETYQQAVPYINKALQGEYVTYDISIPHAKKGKRFVTVNYIPHTEQGQTLGFYAIVFDITERVKSERALQEALWEMEQKNQELSKINQLLDNFVYMAAHDLKSPVANLKLLSGMLVRVDNTVHPELYAAIVESINRLDHTINGLVEVIEIQSVQDIPVKEVAFHTILELIMQELAEEIKATESQIQADFSQRPAIRYVEAYLLSIIKNLLTNAIKYRSHTRKLCLQLHTQTDTDGLVLLTVSDNGMGMNLAKYGRHVFKPFTRFTSKASGKGLGLHLIKTMVEKNGGNVTLESEVEKGTTFKIYLKEYNGQ